MKKITLVLVLVLSVFLLTACGDIKEGEYPNLKSSNEVEMSSQEVAVLLSSVNTIATDQTVLGVTLNGAIDYQTSGSSLLDASIALNASIDASGYALVTDQIDNAEMILNADLNLTYSQSYSLNGATITNDMNIEGSSNIYYLENFLYLDLNLSSDANGVSKTLEAKQKIDASDFLSEFESSASSEINSVEQLPFDLSNFTVEDIQAVLDAFPAFTVYESGGTIIVEFKIDKAFIVEHYGDLYTALYQIDNGVAPSQEEIDSVVSELNSSLNDAFTTLEYSMALGFTNTEVKQFAISTNIVLNDDYQSNFNFTLVFDKLESMPTFPDDLDTYTEVSDFESMLSGLLG